GGLLVAVAEMALAANLGATLEPPPAGMAPHAWAFGEDQGRYVLTAAAHQAAVIATRAQAAGVPLARLGTVGGDALTLTSTDTILLAALRDRHEAWLPAYMAAAS